MRIVCIISPIQLFYYKISVCTVKLFYYYCLNFTGLNNSLLSRIYCKDLLDFKDFTDRTELDNVHLVVMTGLVPVLRKVVERKQTKASAASTLVPKLKMSLARKTAAFRDPEDRKSLIESSRDCRIFFSLFFPIFLSRSANQYYINSDISMTASL